MVRDISVATAEPEMSFGADFFNNPDFVDVAEDLLTEDFLNSPVWSPPDSPNSCSSSENELDSVLSCSDFDSFTVIKLEKHMDFDVIEEISLPASPAPCKPAISCTATVTVAAAAAAASTTTSSAASSSIADDTPSTTSSCSSSSSSSTTCAKSSVMWTSSNTSTTTTATTKSAAGEQKLMWTPPASPLPLDEFDALDASITLAFDDDDFLMSGAMSHDLFAMDDIQPGNKRKAARLDDSIESKKARARATRDEITLRAQAALGNLKTETPELKRITHNVLERKRRNDLKVSYQELREHIPELKHVDRAPTGQILLKAVEYVEQLKKAEQQLLQSIAQAKAENEKLKAASTVRPN